MFFFFSRIDRQGTDILACNPSILLQLPQFARDINVTSSDKRRMWAGVLNWGWGGGGGGGVCRIKCTRTIVIIILVQFHTMSGCLRVIIILKKTLF